MGERGRPFAKPLSPSLPNDFSNDKVYHNHTLYSEYCLTALKPSGYNELQEQAVSSGQ
jgi:hypothetical protein